MEHSSGVNNPLYNQEVSNNQKLDLDTRNLKFFKEDIFRLPFDKLGNSSNYKHFQHVFTDEDDYEDFKQDLVNFHRLNGRWKDDRKKVSKERRLTAISNSGAFDYPGTSCDTACAKSLDDSVLKESFKKIDSPIKETVDDSVVGLSTDAALDNFLGFGDSSIPMMEFFQNDEHFQEFDRVFETVKNKKRYASNSSLEKYRWSPHPEDEDNKQDNCADDNLEDQGVFDELKIDDIFSDFFDNDSDFKLFEEEFDKFQKRRSRTLERWHRNSVCDLIEDLKAFCDNETTQSSEKPNLKVENKLSLPNLWNQGGEWDYIFDKIRQHGKLSSESSNTSRSDLTVTCDEESGNYLLDDLSDSNRDTGYYSEDKFNGDSCSCQCPNKHTCNDCQYTCHHKCLSLIQLDCKSLSHDQQEDEGAVLTGEPPLADLNTALPSTELSSEPATEKDETDSGYRSGTIPDEKLPYRPSQATLNREDLKKRITEYNKLMPGANFAVKEEEINKEEPSFQGFIKVTLNLVRPISMSLGARPPSIYEVLTREHIVEQNTQNISFYMPRDTVRSIHAQSNQSTKEVVTLLLKKFHILDHPRKFALYEQELKNNKIAKIRRVKDAECPLALCLNWELENVVNHRLVLQENETGEIDWEAFCVPELNNFLRVLDREEDEYMAQLKYKYKVMRRIIQQRMKELRLERERKKRASIAQESSS